MRTLFSLRTWGAVGLLLLAAGAPYCAAAYVAASQPSVATRADIEIGVLLAVMGWSVLSAVVILWLWLYLRRERRASSP